MRAGLALCVFVVALALGGAAAAQDLVVSGTDMVIDSDLEVDGSVYVEEGGTLTIRNARLTLLLDYDEEHHVDVADTSELVLENARIDSVGGQYWFELYGDERGSPTMRVSGASTWLTNHSGIRPFDDTRIIVTGGDVEEIQVRDRVVVELSDAAAYPVYFFAGQTATLSGLYTDTEYTITNTVSVPEGWRMSLADAWVEGYQIDLEPGSNVTLSDSDGIVLSIHTPGDLGPELRVVEGLTADTRIAHGLTDNLGSRFEFTNSNIALFNLYVFGTDRVLLRDLHVNEVNAEAGSELIVGQEGTTTLLNCNLCQVYDHATFTVDHATIDPRDNLPSATASFHDLDTVGRGVMTFREMDLRDLDLTVIEQGTIRLHNCSYDPAKLSVQGADASFEDYQLAVDFAAAPTTGPAPLTVQFSDLSTGEVEGHSWDFGDGGSSTEASPAHTYQTAGTFSVALTVTGPAGSNTLVRQDLVRVGSTPSGACTGDPVLIPAAAHAGGAAGSAWRTDVAVFNARDDQAELALRFLAADSDNSEAACVAVDGVSGWASAGLDDVVATVFGLQSAVGGLAVYSDSTETVVMSRTYNQSADGTFGQTIPGRHATEGIAAGDVGVLVGLHENPQYRTNVGLLNTADAPASVTVELYAADGAYLGSRQLDLQPLAQHQENRVFSLVTAAPVTNGRAEVAVTAGGPVLAYASVVDNQTGDPSYIEPW